MKLYDKLAAVFPQLAGYFLVIFITAVIVWKLSKFVIRTNKICGEFEGIKTMLAVIKDNVLLLTNAALNDKKIDPTRSRGNSADA